MKRIDKGNEARRAARNKAAKPRATQRIPDKKREEPDEESCPYCAVRGCEGFCPEYYEREEP